MVSIGLWRFLSSARRRRLSAVDLFFSCRLLLCLLEQGFLDLFIVMPSRCLTVLVVVIQLQRKRVNLAFDLKVATKAADRFGAMLAVSVSVLLMTHLFVNVGMTIGITPITGLPLPFLSYGGTFLVTCFLMLGVVQSVYRHRKEFR